MQVLVVDDHPLVHEIVPALLRKALPGASVAAETTLEGALAKAGRRPAPDLVLLDLGLPGYKGLQAFIRFRKRFPRLRVAVISANDDRRTIFAAMDRGAAGYIPKTYTPGRMVAALQVIAAGQTFVPPEALAVGRPAATDRPRYRRGLEVELTDRQMDVLRLIVKGYGNERIAAELSIAENTVKQHAHAVFAALGVSSRAEAMVAAVRRGLRVE